MTKKPLEGAQNAASNFFSSMANAVKIPSVSVCLLIYYFFVRGVLFQETDLSFVTLFTKIKFQNTIMMWLQNKSKNA